MRKTFLLLYLAIAAPTIYSQDSKSFTSSWEGTLNVGAELRIVFHIKANSNGSLSASADSPDQSAYGLKCDTAFVYAEGITIEMHKLNAVFTGKLINDSTIEGTFTQGVGLPLILKRKNENLVQATALVQIAPSYYTITDVSVKQKDVTLSGTLFQPTANKKPPVVLIIAGSGPTDRDGNSLALPGKNNSLLQLADSLALHGIASLRYDKRGIGKSKSEKVFTESDLTFNDIANDAKAMYEWLKAQGYTAIFIAGHSEGSLIGMLIAGQVEPKGFISIAGAGRKAGDILKEQTKVQFSPELQNEFDNAIDSLDRGLSVTKVNPALMNLLRPSIQPYMKSWLSLDPQKLTAAMKCKILVLQGTKDMQIKDEDAQNIYKAAKQADLVIIKNMNHVLKEVVSDSKKDNADAYSNPDLSLIGQFVTAIVNFVIPSR